MAAAIHGVNGVLQVYVFYPHSCDIWLYLPMETGETKRKKKCSDHI